MDRYHLVCILKRIVPVEFARHNERAVGIGSKVLGIGGDILSEDLLSGEQVPCDECSTDGRSGSKELGRGDGKLLRDKT